MSRVTQDKLPEHLSAGLKIMLLPHSFPSSPSPPPSSSSLLSSLHCSHSPLLKGESLPKVGLQLHCFLLPPDHLSLSALRPLSLKSTPPLQVNKDSYLPDRSFSTALLLCIVLVFARLHPTPPSPPTPAPRWTREYMNYLFMFPVLHILILAAWSLKKITPLCYMYQMSIC